MFDISWTEFLLIGAVALIVIGPKELPGVMRTLGQYTRKARAMAAEFQNQFQEAMREAEMTDLKKQVDDMASDIKNYDPLKEVRSDFESMGKDLETSLGQSSAPKPEEAPPEPAASTDVPEQLPLALTPQLEAAASPQPDAAQAPAGLGTDVAVEAVPPGEPAVPAAAEPAAPPAESAVPAAADSPAPVVEPAVPVAEPAMPVAQPAAPVAEPAVSERS